MRAKNPGRAARSASLAIALTGGFALAAVILAPAAPANAAAPTCVVSEATAVWDSGADELRTDGAISAEGGILTFDGGAGVLEPVRPSGSLSFDGTIAYTSVAGVETTLSAPTLVIDGGSVDQVLLAVHNSGAIPAGEIGVIFEPFRRGNTSHAGGLGLGLYICREIARAHGGDVTAESNPVSGTTFRVALPRMPEQTS